MARAPLLVDATGVAGRSAPFFRRPQDLPCQRLPWRPYAKFLKCLGGVAILVDGAARACFSYSQGEIAAIREVKGVDEVI
jgi:hypothetical protein